MKKQWQNKERKDAVAFEARRTPRSGGLWFAKGDSKSDKYLIENKTSKYECFRITTNLWKKISREALLNQRVPVVSIEFGKDKMELVILSKDDFLSL
jgi:hypothetical protein